VAVTEEEGPGFEKSVALFANLFDMLKPLGPLSVTMVACEALRFQG
jgi:hypothetical protein